MSVPLNVSYWDMKLERELLFPSISGSSIGSDSWVAEAVSKPGLWSQQQQPLSADPGQPREGQGRHCRARSKGTIVEGEPWNPLMGCLKCS